jgi:hypothetical protein
LGVLKFLGEEKIGGQGCAGGSKGTGRRTIEAVTVNEQ